MDDPEFTQSDRGFKFMEPIVGRYGGGIRLSESSSAEHPRIWLTVKEADDLNEATAALAMGMPYTGTYHDAGILLGADDVQRLRFQLNWILEHHYQGDVRGYVEADNED